MLELETRKRAFGETVVSYMIERNTHDDLNTDKRGRAAGGSLGCKQGFKIIFSLAIYFEIRD